MTRFLKMNRIGLVHDAPWLFSASVPLVLVVGLTAAKEIPPGEILWQEGAAYRSEGRHLQEAGDLQRAVAAYRHAIGVNPHYAEAYNDLGVVLESGGNTVRAEEAYKTALRLKPGLAAAHSNLALLYEEAGRVQEAVEHWTARVRMGPPDDPWVARARGKLGRNPPSVPERAEVEAQVKQPLKETQAKKVERSPEPEQIAGTEAQRRAEQVRMESIRLKEAGRRAAEPEKKSSMAVAAPVAAQRPAPEEAPPRASAQPVSKSAQAVAEEYARERSRLRQTTARELYDRAVLSMREGNYQEAADQFRQILALDPNHRDARRGLERAELALARELP